ncbi:MAG: pyridoxal phosphate-dependent aminotransferase [Bacteroidetes bacterium]|nr:pyridoxal phosphate-dependent aminotransferase [Bacteroidota bacterium]
MLYRRMPIEIESPEQLGYGSIRNNLSESSYADAFFRDIPLDVDLRDLVLCYGPHAGHEGLRRLIAWDAAPQASSGPIRPEDVLLTVGAAGALFIIATTLLEKDDEIVVVRPNYATNIETPRAIGAKVRFIDLRFEDGFALDPEEVGRAIAPSTKYISVTYPHNPTGVRLEGGRLAELVQVAGNRGVRLLVDETYRDMVFGEQLPLAATASPDVISVSSLSKTYGLPGLRTGWIVCRDAQLMQRFLAAKEQMHICGPVVDEELAYRYFLHKSEYHGRIRADIAEKFGIVKMWMQQQDDFEWVQPGGGCVCFPRVRRPEDLDMDKFYRILLEKHGTYVGPGHWFDMPKHYMRIGYGWPTQAQLKEGLEALNKTLPEAG